MHNWKHLDDDGKLRQKYRNKRANARKEGLECELTFDDYCTLVESAGLKSSDLGFSGKKYVLARYGDMGNYTMGNCRFILQSENAAEKKVSDKARAASRRNIVSYMERRTFEKHEKVALSYRKAMEQVTEHHNSSPKWKAYCERRAAAKLQHDAIRQAAKDPRYVGEHNSSFGSHWITNRVSNMKWRSFEGPMPAGYRLGRVCKGV